MATLSEDEIVKNQELVKKLAKSPKLAERGLVKLFDELPEYFLAPASSRTDYHGCFVGGLCDHSLRVTKNLKEIAKVMAPDKYYPETLVLVGLLHDIGKVGDVDKPLYVPNPSEWHRNKGMLFETNKELLYMPTCDRSIYILQHFKISLSVEEFIAIRISDGPYEKCNEKYNMKEPDLALLLHFADRMACAQEKQLQ